MLVLLDADGTATAIGGFALGIGLYVGVALFGYFVLGFHFFGVNYGRRVCAVCSQRAPFGWPGHPWKCKRCGFELDKDGDPRVNTVEAARQLISGKVSRSSNRPDEMDAEIREINDQTLRD